MNSVVDAPVRLAELFENELLAELCEAHTRVEGVGVQVFDAEGQRLVDVTPDRALLDYLFEFASARRALTEVVGALKRTELDRGEWAVRQDSVSGTRYLVMPITYEFETLGKLVYGPYLDIEAPRRFSPSQAGQEIDVDRLNMLRDGLPRLSDGVMLQRGEVLAHSIDVVCHAGYKALLTSKTHLASITGAYNDLQSAHDELARSNAQLRTTNARLRELDMLKSNFLATVSHELRTPLTSVIGYTEMLLEQLAGPINDEQREYLSTIMERGENLLQLISSLLDISRIESGASTKIELDPVELSPLVENALSMVRPQAKKGDVNLYRELDTLPVLQLDRTKILQALVNLLSNAVKFTPPGGRVTVRARRVEDTVELQVEDTGIGIPPDQQSRIFQAFFQVDNSSTRKYGGTGLGLSIVKSFVEAHGGRVSVHSKPGAGARFVLHLPVDEVRRSRPPGPIP